MFCLIMVGLKKHQKKKTEEENKEIIIVLTLLLGCVAVLFRQKKILSETLNSDYIAGNYYLMLRRYI